jgi:hypothetical protein
MIVRFIVFSRAVSATSVKKDRALAKAPVYCPVVIIKVDDSSRLQRQQGNFMLKFVIVGTASLALAGTAVAADLPRPQPVVQTAPVGKWPVGKTPIGKYPVGKYPIGKAPTPAVVTKG